MKIEQALVLYLLKHKSLSLEGLGTFTVDAPIPEVTDSDRPVVIPPNSVSFHYDPKTREEEEIVDFIVEYTKKIKPLASADLNSFLTLGRQFLNIGKPFTIQNLGTLEKLKSGELEFRPGQVVLQKMEPPRDTTENNLEENDADNLFNDYQQSTSSGSGRRVFITLLILAVVAAGGWALWTYAFKKEKLPETEAIVPVVDTSTAPSSMEDSGTFTPDSLAANPYGDSIAYNIVIQESQNLASLQKREARLRSFGRKVEITTADSLNFRLITPMISLPADTGRILDSLNKFYLGKAHIEVK